MAIVFELACVKGWLETVTVCETAAGSGLRGFDRCFHFPRDPLRPPDYRKKNRTGILISKMISRKKKKKMISREFPGGVVVRDSRLSQLWVQV